MKKIVHSRVSEIFVIIETPSFIALVGRRRKAGVTVCVDNTQCQKGLYMIQYLRKKNIIIRKVFKMQ